MNTYKLEKYNGIKSRYSCTECGSKNQFARYVDTDGNYIADHVGRCNRESKCGYHFTPKQYFENNPTASIQPRRQPKTELVKETQYVNHDVLKATLKPVNYNTFQNYLIELFGGAIAESLKAKYNLGTTRDKSCIFWQVDNLGRVRTGQATRYGLDGHRIKGTTRFIHGKLGIENIEQCLFGLHLLICNPDLPIGLVESEKTAVIMAGKLPDYNWMATGGKLNLSKKVHALKGKKVVAFPDSDGYNEWKERLTPYGFKISNALHKLLTPEQQREGLDLADFVSKHKTILKR